MKSRKVVLCTVAVLASIASSTMSSSAQSSQPKRPVFTPLVTLPHIKIEIDSSTLTSLKGPEGDTQVGAVFKLIMKEPIEVEGGRYIGSFINASIAICGKNKLVTVNSKLFDLNGALLNEEKRISISEDKKIPTAPVTEIYKFLCKDVKPPQPQTGNTYT